MKKLLCPLLFTCWVGGVCDMKYTKARKIYVIFLILLHIVSFCYFCYQEDFLKFREFPLFLVVDLSANFILGCGCVCTIVTVNFVNRGKYEKLTERFDIFDERIDETPKSRKYLFWTILILERIQILVMFAVDTWTWYISQSLYVYKRYVARNVQLFFIDSVRLLILWTAFEVCERLKLVRNSLMSIGGDDFPNSSNNNKRLKMDKFIKKVKNLSKLYILLCDGTDLLNQIFGITILFDILISIAFPLEHVIMLIFISLSTEQVDGLPGISRYLVFGMWIAEFMVGIKYFGSLINGLANKKRCSGDFYLIDL